MSLTRGSGCAVFFHRVELTVVDAETPASVLLFDENSRAR